MMLTYQDEKVGTIRYAVLSDCQVIGENMRAQDAMEIWSFNRMRSTQAVINSFSKSIIGNFID